VSRAELALLLEPIVWIGWILAGACVGSYLNVCVFRLPRRCLSVARPARSFCPRCRAQIAWYDNLPVLSWLLLRARCRSCQGAIAPRYPLVELATAAAFGWLVARDLLGRLEDPAAWGLLVAHSVLFSALLVLALIDLELEVLPDAITVPGLLVAPLVAAALPALIVGGPPDPGSALAWAGVRLDGPLGWWGLEGWGIALAEAGEGLARSSAQRPLGGLLGGLLGASLGAGFLYGVGVTFSALLGREAMGFGDVKLIALVGGLLGWRGVVLTLMIACVTGAVGGLLRRVATGEPHLSGRALETEAWAPLARLLVRAPPPGHDSSAPLPLRAGAAPLARLLTGDPYVPFGPFLALGAAAVALGPPGWWAGR